MQKVNPQAQLCDKETIVDLISRRSACASKDLCAFNANAREELEAQHQRTWKVSSGYNSAHITILIRVSRHRLPKTSRDGTGGQIKT